MDHWTEIFTAYCVARSGTVSKAAEELGVHRATVNRHIDALEAAWGTKLFLRHRRGYELTDIGREFLQVASRAHDVLEDFSNRIRVRRSELEGDVIVTTLAPLTTLVVPAVLEFRRRHPLTRVTVHTDDALARLEKAEAHVALRVGARPAHDDYVVQHFTTLKFALFSHQSYIDRHGMPEGHDLRGHQVIGNPDKHSPAPFEAWLDQNVPAEQVVLRATNPKVLEEALCAGQGIGFLPSTIARQLPDLHQIGPALPEWQVQSWLVTHVDVHRTDRVRSMLDCLREAAPEP
ncbi:MAG: LysR family transcriptional regulator [Pseudomonadota bacterium]